MERLGFWRSVSGLATVVIASVGTRSVSDVVVADTGGKVITNGTVGLIAVPVSVAVVYFLTLPGFRRELGFRSIARKLTLLTVTVILPVVVITLFLIGKEIPFKGMNVLLILLIVIALLWYLVYLLCVLYWAGRTYCWIGEFHPLLAPTVTAIVVSGITMLDLAALDTKGLALDVWLVITLSGLVSTVWLAVAEYRQIRDENVGWRTGPVAQRARSAN